MNTMNTMNTMTRVALRCIALRCAALLCSSARVYMYVPAREPRRDFSKLLQ